MFFTLEQMVVSADDMFRMLTQGVNKEVERYHHSDSKVQRADAAHLLGELHKSIIDLSYSLKSAQASLLDIDEGHPDKTYLIDTDKDKVEIDLAKSVLTDLAKINDDGHRPV